MKINTKNTLNLMGNYYTDLDRHLGSLTSGDFPFLASVSLSVKWGELLLARH